MKKTWILFAFLMQSFICNAQYQYSTPVQPNLNGLGTAVNTIQNRYNNNTKRVQKAVDRLKSQILDLDISDEKKSVVFFNLVDRVKLLNQKRYDYSSNNVTDSVINYLYDSVNKDLRN